MTIPGKRGAPVKYELEQLKKGIDEYFIYVDYINKERKLKNEKLKPYTISGICVFLDICRDTWWEYSKKQDYTDTIKKAKMKVENYVEEGLLSGTTNPIGSIFNLKNNFGWKDSFEVVANQPEQLKQDDIKLKLEELKKDRNNKSIDTTSLQG